MTPEPAPAPAPAPSPPSTASRLPPRPRRWPRILRGFLLFLAGLLVGAGFVISRARHRFQESLRDPDVAAQRFAGRLASRLELTEGQQEKVRGIARRRVAALRDLLLEGADEIEAALETPEQKARWRKARDAFRERVGPR